MWLLMIAWPIGPRHGPMRYSSAAGPKHSVRLNRPAANITALSAISNYQAICLRYHRRYFLRRASACCAAFTRDSAAAVCCAGAAIKSSNEKILCSVAGRAISQSCVEATKLLPDNRTSA